MADWCSGPHWKLLFFLVRSQRQVNKDANLGTNLLTNCTIPRKVCRSARLSEGSMLVSASIFRGSGLRPLALMILPKKRISVHLILHLSALKWRPGLRACSMTALTEVMSVDNYVVNDASDTREVIRCLIYFLLEISWVQIRPKRSCKNWFLPCGELKVLHSKLSWFWHSSTSCGRQQQRSILHYLTLVGCLPVLECCGVTSASSSFQVAHMELQVLAVGLKDWWDCRVQGNMELSFETANALKAVLILANKLLLCICIA